MPNNWKTYNLGDVIEIKYGKDHKKLQEGKIPCYGTGGIMRFVERAISEEESVLIPRKGSLNNIYYINEPFWTVDTLFWTKVNADFVNAKYLYYNLKIVDFASKDVGSAIPSLTTSLLKRLEITLPPLPEQKAIASILTAIDDKIELNLQINKTLEEMAMTLYKHWFVDFGPFKDGKFIDSELGMIPEGWEVVDLKSICDVINGRAYKNDEFLSEGTPIIRIQNLKGGGKTVYSDLILPESKYVESGDLIYAWSATFGPYIWHGPKSIYHYHIWHLAVFPEKVSKYYLFHHLLRTSNQMKEHGTGSIFTHLTKGTMETQRVLLPAKNVMKEYHQNAALYGEKILLNKDENQTLTTLRDTLLPKLISGEVRVEDVQQTLDQAL